MTECIELDGVVYKFSRLTLKHEDEWRDWLRGRIKNEAYRDSEGWDAATRADYLARVSQKVAGGQAAFLSEYGMQTLSEPDGACKVLEMASRVNHPAPHVPQDVLRRLFSEQPERVEEVIIAVLPIPPRARAALEKKLLESRASAQALATTSSDGPTDGPI